MKRLIFATILFTFMFVVFAPVAEARNVLREPTLDELNHAKNIASGSSSTWDPSLKALKTRHAEWQSDFVKRSYEWHLFSTKIIFWSVLIVVAFGLVVSWQQFRKDIDEPARDGQSEVTPYDVSASLQNLSIKSKTIGALILIFSGTFFFLYLTIVYPINDAGQRTVVDSSPSSS